MHRFFCSGGGGAHAREKVSPLIHEANYHTTRLLLWLYSKPSSLGSNETMDNSTAAFDTEELKHLAIKAMRSERDEDALRLLKAALAKTPRDPDLLYLLGMAHSNLGMTDRAIEELDEVLALAPQLINCRFQLGLLHFTQRNFKRAEAVWAPLLSALEEDDPLCAFSAGLTQSWNDRFEEAIPLL